MAWLLTTRPGDVPLVETLGREPSFGTVTLGPLAASDIIAIARDQLGTPPPGPARDLLAWAGGHPFLAVQAITGGLVPAVGRLLRTLPARAVDLVRVAAVFGEPLPIDDATALLDGWPATAAAEAADEAIAAGVLSSEYGALRFRHGLVREPPGSS